MSLSHTATDILDRSAGPIRADRSFNAALALAVKVGDHIADLVAGIRHRAEIKRFDRFSDHTLHDIGFERDWDGSVIKRQQ